jgi:hypothetical protein
LEFSVTINQPSNAKIGELGTICERQSFDSFAVHKGLNSPIIDFVRDE